MPETPTRIRPLVDLTSGYFGLYQPYQEHILASDVATRIVAAGPKVNDHAVPQSSNNTPMLILARQMDFMGQLVYQVGYLRVILF